MTLEEAADRLAISDLLARYCHALDRKDWPASRNLFAADAVLDFTAFGGPRGSVGTIEGFLAPVLDSLRASQHITAAIMIDFHAGGARARSAAIVPMVSPSSEGSEAVHVSGLWYEDELIRTELGWRIHTRRQVRGYAFTAS